MPFSFFRGLVLVVAAFCATGCASSKSYVVLLESPDGTTGAIVVQTANGTTRVDKKHDAVALDGKSAALFAVEQPRIDQDFSAALKAQPALPKQFLLYFETGTAKLTKQSQADIQNVLVTLRERGPSAVSVIGHTDTEGKSNWNEQIGLKRATAIAELLKKEGIQVIELVVTSHGESNLLVKTPDDTAEPRNRRVEIIVR
jgi:outer membrane protein OmpA-like peptidoglycan-associated protein